MKKTISVLLLGALACAAVLGLVVYRSVQAAVPAAATNSNILAPSARDAQASRAGFGKGFGGGYTNEDLANALGISVDELNAAIQKANEAALDQAVTDGLITQAQADQIRARGAAFPFGGHWGGWLSQNGLEYDTFLADALGITVEELQAAYAQAYAARIDQAVTDGRITQEQADLMKGQYALMTSEKFQSAMQSAFEEAVSQAVADGLITQAQADLILQNRDGAGFPGFGGFGRGPGGGFGPHGGRGDRLPGSDVPATPTEAPSSDL
jgi:hypothetical protein